MSEINFLVHEHEVPAQHIRELPNTLLVEDGSPESTLRLSVKQYIPLNNPKPSSGDITILASFASGYNKEIYEPLWDDLLLALAQSDANVRVRGIWAVDGVQSGRSYILNEHLLAHDAGICWDDHARDLLCVVNAFRREMPAPLLGFGHSMGAAQFITLGTLHPRLFHSMVLLDPWLSSITSAIAPDTLWKRFKARDRGFKDTQAVRKAYAKIPMYKPWDTRSFDRFIETAFRRRSVRGIAGNLTEEFWPIMPSSLNIHTNRRIYADRIDFDPETATRADRLAYPDLVYGLDGRWPYCQPQSAHVTQHLPRLRSRVLFLWGDAGSCIPPDARGAIMQSTGIESGGSGGARLGCAQDDIVAGSHFFPLENPKGTAQRLAEWCQVEQRVWKEEKEMLDRRFGQAKSVEERQRFPEDFDVVRKRWGLPEKSKL